MRATLKDIANELNLTINTVSRALKDKPDISQKTISLVKSKAKEFGYVPNIAASSLRNGRSKTIALVYDNYLNPYYSIMTMLIEGVLQKAGYSIMIFTNQNEKAEIEEPLSKRILSHSVDGVISFLQINQSIKQLFDLNKMPCIVIGRDSTIFGVDSILSEDEIGGYTATKHLLEMGRRKILMFTFNDFIYVGKERLRGYKRALKEFGVEYDEKLVLVAGVDGCTGCELIKTAYKKGVEFDGIFCVNDQLAFESISKLEKEGVSLPSQCSIVGYDYLQSHLDLPCKLTTIDNDKVQMAETACGVIIHKIENPKNQHKLFTKINKVELIKGKTT